MTYSAAAKVLTEWQIEYRVEKETDALDHALMNNILSQDEYNAAIKSLDAWANTQYDLIAR